MRVLSLFDGIACGLLALKRAGISVTEYYASEVDKTAIKVAMANHPEIIQLGCVKSLDLKSLPPIDLLIGGSPCQGFSCVGKKLNFDDTRSALFFDFVRVYRKIKPKYVLLENVKMKKAWENVISDYMCLDPVLLDSRLVSAQSRQRLYWTNLPRLTVPEDRGLLFNAIAERRGYPARVTGRRICPVRFVRDDYGTHPCLQYVECRMDGKQGCLTTVATDTVVSPECIERCHADSIDWRNMSAIERERCQTLPDGYTACAGSYSARVTLTGNCWTVDMIAHLLSGLS